MVEAQYVGPSGQVMHSSYLHACRHIAYKGQIHESHGIYTQHMYMGYTCTREIYTTHKQHSTHTRHIHIRRPYIYTRLSHTGAWYLHAHVTCHASRPCTWYLHAHVTCHASRPCTWFFGMRKCPGYATSLSCRGSVAALLGSKVKVTRDRGMDSYRKRASLSRAGWLGAQLSGAAGGAPVHLVRVVPGLRIAI